MAGRWPGARWPRTAICLVSGLVSGLLLSCAPQAAQPATPFAVTDVPADRLRQDLAAGHVSSAQLVEQYLARVHDLDQNGPGLRSILATNPDARAEARRLDGERAAGRLRGPLHGIPIALKDLIDAHGTTSYMYDSQGRQISVTDPLGHTTSTHYNAAGNVDYSYDANGNETQELLRDKPRAGQAAGKVLGTRVLAWNEEDRLRAVSQQGERFERTDTAESLLARLGVAHDDLSRLRRMGVQRALSRLKVKDGERVRIGGVDVAWEM